MSQAVIEKQETPDLVKTPPPDLRHLLCRCQLNVYPVVRARCGIRVAGKAVSRSSIRAVDICVICADLEQTRTPCKHCGKAPLS